ncbi:hypothetical protein ACOSQ3_009823 [Xanthoceras sorbifolium]
MSSKSKEANASSDLRRKHDFLHRSKGHCCFLELGLTLGRDARSNHEQKKISVLEEREERGGCELEREEPM